MPQKYDQKSLLEKQQNLLGKIEQKFLRKSKKDQKSGSLDRGVGVRVGGDGDGLGESEIQGYGEKIGILLPRGMGEALGGKG